ncbi:MAG TPA: Crp/Fnr family transcriptional regulator [Fibrobacteria bacterium]|nr:Crp/Fnr family transcriptional regulator [Fibrobacteria bacterium]
MSSKLFKKVVRAYAAGEVIFEQGSEVDGIYSVQCGRVSVYKTKPSPQGPVDIELAQLGPGSMFGEMGMLDQAKRDASVKAVEFTEVLIITKDMFENQMVLLPAWIVNFIKILVSRLRATNNRLTEAIQVLEANGLKLDERAPGDKAANPEKTEKPARASEAGPEKPAA